MKTIWEDLQYFSPQEAWGDADRMDPTFLAQLDHFRHAVKCPFQVLRGFATAGHSEHSYHYKGRAVDGRFLHPETKEALSLAEHLLIAFKAPFGGVGIYTWGSGGPFLHFDNRFVSHERKIWISRRAGLYEPLTEAFLQDALKA